MNHPARLNLTPQRERLFELGLYVRPRLRAPARVQHHAQDAVNAEPEVPEAGVNVAIFISARAGQWCRTGTPKFRSLLGLAPVLIRRETRLHPRLHPALDVRDVGETHLFQITSASRTVGTERTDGDDRTRAVL